MITKKPDLIISIPTAEIPQVCSSNFLTCEVWSA